MASLDQLQNLDLSDIGNWPPLYRWVFSALIWAACAGVFYGSLISEPMDRLNQARQQEQTLRQGYRQAVALAAQLEVYRQQHQGVLSQLDLLLNRLPSSDETARLLDDLTYHAVSSGLEIHQIRWQAEKPNDFYVALPIGIQVQGRYHELGEFVARIASLPRIITLHDFTIQAQADNHLEISLSAQTYRYTGHKERKQ